MSKAEILEEIVKLTSADRREIAAKISELEGDGWLDNGELTDEEKRIIEERFDACESDPKGFIPWEEAKARLKAEFRR